MPQARGQETRAAILAAAKQCLLANGYAKTTFEQISSVGQTSVGSIQYHFPDRTEIFAALYQALSDESMAWLETRLAGLDQRANRLRITLHDYIAVGMGEDHQALTLLRLATRFDPRLQLKLQITIQDYDRANLDRWRNAAQAIGLPAQGLVRTITWVNLGRDALGFLACVEPSGKDAPGLQAFFSQQIEAVDIDLAKTLRAG